MPADQQVQESARDWGAAFGYTVATGNLWLPFSEFQRRAEALLGRPILTHEFAEKPIWVEMRDVIEREARDYA